MAEGTRLKQIEAQLQEFREFMASTQQFMVDTKKQQDETTQSFVEVEKNADRRQEQLIELMRSLLPVDREPRDSRQDVDPIPREQGVQIQPVRGILGAGRPIERIQDSVAGNSEANSPQELRSWNSEGRGGHTRLPKLDFPTFDGSNPRSWTRKCEQSQDEDCSGVDNLVVEDDTTVINSRDPVVLHLDQYPESVTKDDDCSLIDANIGKFKVSSNSLTMNFDVEPKEMGNSTAVSIVATESNVAHKVFDIMSRRRKFTLVLGDKILALFASGLTLISSAVDATMKAAIVDHSLPWDPGGNCCYWFLILKETCASRISTGLMKNSRLSLVQDVNVLNFFLWAWNLLASVELVAAAAFWEILLWWFGSTSGLLHLLGMVWTNAELCARSSPCTYQYSPSELLYFIVFDAVMSHATN